MAGRSPASSSRNCVEQLARPLAAALPAQVVEPADHVEVLEPGEVLVDGGVLAGEPDPAAYLGRVGQHVDAGDLGPAGVGAQQRGEDAHRGRLAGAVGPEQPQHGALGHLQVDAVERLDVAVVLDQSFSDHCVSHVGHCDTGHRQASSELREAYRPDQPAAPMTRPRGAAQAKTRS